MVMMNFIFCILLLRLFGEISGSVLYALRGKPVVLFPNVTLEKNKTRLELYINGEHDYAHIVTWVLNSSTVILEFNTTNNIYMDTYRNILMCHVSDNDKGKYIIKYIISVDNIVENTLGPEQELFIYEESTADKQLLKCWGDHPGVTEKLSDGQSLEADPKMTLILVFVIILVVISIAAIIIMVMVNKVRIIAWIRWKKMQITSHRDSPNSTSYQLMWKKPVDGGYQLQKYIIRYREVLIKQGTMDYELDKPLSSFVLVDNIPQSDESCMLSSLIPGKYYQVEIKAIFAQGQSSSQNFIFKTKEGIPKPVHVTSHCDSPNSTSYQLLWDKPDDGGSPLQKYIISYGEVQIKAESTEYELDWPLNPFVTVDNIPPSNLCYTLSDLKAGTYYQVEIKAINNQGQSFPQSFIFKTKETQTDLELQDISASRSETENKQGKETIPLLDISQQQEKQFVSDADKPNLSLKRRFSGRTHDNSRKCWLLDLVLNPDDDLIVTDGENNELKKFSLEGTLKSKLSFKTRPDCLALTDGYLAMVTFPHETVLRVIDTRDELSLVSTIPFKSQCAGIGSMNDGRLIICNRESKSVIVRSKDGEILQEIKTGSSGETLFRKPSYVRVVDSRTIYVSDYRTKEFFIININDDNTFTINKHQINYPRTSCVVDGMLLVASSNIRLFTLDGNEAGEVTLNGVKHVRGLAFSEGKRLLVITHQSDGGDEVISVYEVMKH